MSKFDQEYYVMNIDGAKNHPLLAWGKTRRAPFLMANTVNTATLELPLKVVFTQPYPKEYEMADLLMLSAQFSGSQKLKYFIEEQKIYGVQFVPIEIESNKKEIITGHYVFHIWNRIPAIDKNNYEGDIVDEDGMILTLESFSLDQDILEKIPLEQRTIFSLTENPNKIIVHRVLYDALKNENLTGISFSRVDDWSDDAFFR